MPKREFEEIDDVDYEDDFEDVPEDNLNSNGDMGFNDDPYNDLNDFNDYGMDGFGQIPPMEKHNDLLKQLTNFALYLKDTVNGWLGLSWDETTGKYVKCDTIHPIMNQHCAAWCVSFLKTYARGNNIITDMGSETYKFMMHDIIENIWLNIGTRADVDFGINEDGDILRICNEMEHGAALVLMGAGDGRYNKFLAGTMQTQYRGDVGGMGNQPVINNNYPQQAMGALQKMKKVFFGA